MSPPPTARGARSRDPEPSEPHGPGPRVNTCSSSCLSWLHPLRSWSLRQTRGGSFRLLRGADKHLSAVGLPLSRQHRLVPKAAATQPAAPANLGTDDPAYRAVPTVPARAAPVAKPSVPRQTLEVGAECVSSARSDLCGLRLASALKSAVCDAGS